MDNREQCSLFYNPSVGNYLIQYKGNFKEQISKVSYACGSVITGTLAVIAVDEKDFDRLIKDVPSIVYIDTRAMLVLQDISPSYVDNINNIKVNPYLNLTGKGVLVGIIDTGINYLNKEFMREDGTSRIISLWDQTLDPNKYPKTFNTSNNLYNDLYIGQVYFNDEINAAINASNNNQDPYAIVPSKDTIGHGTSVAGIIGGRGYNPDIQGVANDCDFVIVKLFESTNFKKAISENGITPPPVYNISELASALHFLRDEFFRLSRPIVIYIGVGTNDGPHDGDSLVSRYLSSLGDLRGLCLVSGVGNEGAAQGHVSGNIKNVGDISIQELRIPREMKNLSFNIWVQKPNRVSLNIISPTGEATKIINPRISKAETYEFIFTNTQVTVKYLSPENFTGDERISITFLNIKPGIWRFELVGFYIVSGRYDIWLPAHATLPEGVVFLNPDPLNTLVVPSTAVNVVTVAYLGNNSALISSSGKGFNLNLLINPDIATIGINILTTSVSGEKTTLSGSSAASAIVAGGCALILEWGVVKENDPSAYSQKIRSYLIYGATRNPAFKFPNRDIGYGEFNLLGTFNIIARIYASHSREFRSLNNFPLNKYEFIEYCINTLFIRIPKDFGGLNE